MIVETAANLRENLVDCTGDESSILVVSGRAGHGEGLTSAGLTVAHDCSIEAIHDLVDSLLGAVLEDLLLGGVMEKLVKFECPLLLLIVDKTLGAVFGDADSDRLKAIMLAE